MGEATKQLFSGIMRLMGNELTMPGLFLAQHMLLPCCRASVGTNEVGTMLIQCCVCKKYRHKGRWVRNDPRVEHEGRVSHSYCPLCAARAVEEIRTWRRDPASMTGRVVVPFGVREAV